MIDNPSSAMALAEQSKKEEIEKKHQATEKAIDRSISLSALEELKKQNEELYKQSKEHKEELKKTKKYTITTIVVAILTLAVAIASLIVSIIK